MKTTATILFNLLLFMMLPDFVFAQQAQDYMPATFPTSSIFTTTFTEIDAEPEEGPDSEINVTDIEVISEDITRYAITRIEDEVSELNFFTNADSLYTSLGELIGNDFFEEFGFDIDLDLETPTSLMRLSVSENQSWAILEQDFTVPIPDAIFELLPDGVNFQENMDISVQFINTRLPNETIETPFGSFETVVFNPAFNVQVTLYAIVGVPIPIEVTVFDNYGPELFFAEAHGIVKEDLPATIVSVTNTFLGIDEEVTRLPGQTIELKSFESDGTSIENERDIPSALSILPNYPNPFNPSTTLSFELRETGTVTISVYDIQGRLADTITQNELFPTGTHSLSYNAATLASGQYIYSIQFVPVNGGIIEKSTSSFTLVK